MKNPFAKPTSKSFKNALIFALIILISSPCAALIFTLFSPSVAEATMPHLGECDIYYDNVFYPCLNIKEVWISTLLFFAATSILAFIFFLFIPVQEELK